MGIDVRFERDVLAQCLHDPQFFRAARPVVKAHQFSSRRYQFFWSTMIRHWDKTGEAVPAPIWAKKLASRYPDPEDMDAATQSLKKLMRRAPKAPKSALEEIRAFVRMSAIREAAGSMLEGLASGDMDAAAEAMALGMDGVRGVQALEEPESWAEGAEARLKAYLTQEAEVGIPTPLPSLNRYLADGLPPTRLGLVVANTGVGKSTFCIDLGYRALVKTDAVIVHVVTEATKRETMIGYDARLTGINRESLSRGKLSKAEQELFRRRFKAKGKHFAKRLLVLEVDQGADVAVIRTACERAREEHPDKPILFLADCGDHFVPSAQMESHRLNQSAVYWALKGLAKDPTLAPICGWTTTQAPREFESRKPTAAATSESYDKGRIADAMLFLAEDPEAVGDGTADSPRGIIATLLKNRLGGVKHAEIFVEAATAICRFDEVSLGARSKD